MRSLTLALTLALSPAALAQDDAPQPQRLDVDAQDRPALNLLLRLANAADVDLVLTQDLRQELTRRQITLQVHQVTPLRALELVLELSYLTYTNISSNQDHTVLRLERDLPARERVLDANHQADTLLALEHPTPPVIRVVDMQRVFANYSRKAPREAQVNELRQQFRQRLADMRRQLQQARQHVKDLEDAAATPTQLADARIRLASIHAGVERAEQEMQSLLRQAVQDMTLALMDEIEAGAHALATRDGIDLILRTSQPDDDAEFQAQLLAERFTPLHLSPQLDATDALLTLLNDPEFQATLDVH